MNVVTIRELNAHLCKILENVVTSGKEIVVTKSGKPYIRINCCNNSAENVVTIPENVVTSKQKTIDSLRQEIKAVEEKEEIKPEYIGDCEACRKLRVKTPAIGVFEVLTDDSIVRRGLCQRHSTLTVAIV